MKFLEKIQAKQRDPYAPPVTIAFLGDSVTQGCFEVYLAGDGSVQTEYDQAQSYGADFSKLLALLYPSVPIRIINAGISGDNAPRGLQRLEQDVLCCHPDLTIVCYGLNDVLTPSESAAQYCAALEEIIRCLQGCGSEVIFMTPNMMNTYVSSKTTDEAVRQIARDTAAVQSGAKFEHYLNEAKALCKKLGVPLCDCYGRWKDLNRNGVDTTNLLANHINHPIREMHWLFAVSLLETVFEAMPSGRD